MNDVRWPTATEYAAAVQDPEACMVDARLQTAEFKKNPFGMPVPRSGQNAAVFSATIEGQQFAVRFFTTPVDHADRYSALRTRLTQHQLPSFLDAEWVGQAVRFGKGTYPAVLMPWSSGRNLHEEVDERLLSGDVSAISALADRWRSTIVELESAGIVHGDLQHGNAIVAADGTITFIDYDGIWTPELRKSSEEIGHPNYQHPQRAERSDAIATADVFSSLVIFVSLKAIAAEPALWEKHNSGENLLLSQADYVAAGRESDGIWGDLRNSPDSDVVQGAALIEALCGIEVSSFPRFSELMDRGSGALQQASGYVPDRAARSESDEWWDTTNPENEAVPSSAWPPAVDQTPPTAVTATSVNTNAHADSTSQPENPIQRQSKKAEWIAASIIALSLVIIIIALVLAGG